MALALVLRNASKVQAGTLQQNFLRSTSFVATRDFSPLSCQKYNSTLSKSKLTHSLVTPTCGKIMVSPQLRFMSEDHSKLWPIEKAVSASLLVLVPAAIATPNFIFDNLLAIAVVVHFHWGLEAVVVDYVRPIIVGNILPKLALGLLYLISATTLGGLLYYNVNEIGIGKTIKKLWAIK